MKAKMIAAIVATTATALGIFLYRKYQASRQKGSQPVKKNYHLTSAFARAKGMATNN
jgi:hypothetical protein